MAEVGHLDDDIIECVRMEDGDYAVRFDEVDVFVEWDPGTARLVLSVEVGTPPASRAASICEALLAYNSLWRETGGLRLALTGREGAVLQIADLAGPAIDPKTIAIVAVNLVERTSIWRAYFELEADSPQQLLPSSENVFFI